MASSILKPIAAASLSGFDGRSLVGDLYHQRQLIFGSVRDAAAEKADHSRPLLQQWAGAETSKEGRINQVFAGVDVPSGATGAWAPGAVPEGKRSQQIYTYMRHVWPNDWSATFMVTLCRGFCVQSCDPKTHEPRASWQPSWQAQAQYFWHSPDDGIVRCALAPSIAAMPGQQLQSRIFFCHSPKGLAWCMEIAPRAGGRKSYLEVHRPFMGTNPVFQMAYGSKEEPEDGHTFKIGGAYEAWLMTSPHDHPSSMDWSLRYCRQGGEECDDDNLHLPFEAHNFCVEHRARKVCRSSAHTLDASVLVDFPNNASFYVSSRGHSEPTELERYDL